MLNGLEGRLDTRTPQSHAQHTVRASQLLLAQASALLDALPPSSALHQTQTRRSHRPRLKPRPFMASCRQLPRPYPAPGVSCLTWSSSGSRSCSTFLTPSWATTLCRCVCRLWMECLGAPSCISDATRLGQACVWLWVGRDPREERGRGRRRRGARGGRREDRLKRLRQPSVQQHDPTRPTAMCAGCCKQVHGLVAAPAQPA